MINSSTSDTTKDFFEGANILTASAGKQGNTSSITIPSGVTEGILFVCGSSWKTQPDPYAITGNGIISKTSLSNGGGPVNDSTTKVNYEIDYVTLSPGNSITLEATGGAGNSYPCAYMILYY